MASYHDVRTWVREVESKAPVTSAPYGSEQYQKDVLAGLTSQGRGAAEAERLFEAYRYRPVPVGDETPGDETSSVDVPVEEVDLGDETSKGGRPRKWANDAERKAAYKARQKGPDA